MKKKKTGLQNFKPVQHLILKFYLPLKILKTFSGTLKQHFVYFEGSLVWNQVT